MAGADVAALLAPSPWVWPQAKIGWPRAGELVATAVALSPCFWPNAPATMAGEPGTAVLAVRAAP